MYRVSTDAGTIDWPRVALRRRDRLQAAGMFLLPLVGFLGLLATVPPSLTSFLVLLLLASACGPDLFLVSATRILRWRRLGLRIDGAGITIGGDASTAHEKQVPALRFHAPWDAVYKVEIVTDRRALRTMYRAAWTKEGVRAKGLVPTMPPYFACTHMPVLTFRVDLRRVDVPHLPEGMQAGHVWAVPIRDIEAVRAALSTHCTRAKQASPVATTHRQRPVMPTESGHLSRPPERMMEAYTKVGLTEPLPRSFAELEADVVLHHGWPPFLFDLHDLEGGKAAILRNGPPTG